MFVMAFSLFSTLVGLATLLGLVTAVLLVLLHDWRPLLGLLVLEYALLGASSTSFLPLHLAYITLIVGIFVGLILLVTIWQTPATGQVSEVVARWYVGAVGVSTAVAFALTYWLQAGQLNQPFALQWLTITLFALGLLRFLSSTTPLLLGIGLLLLLSSFQLFYLSWNQSLLMVGFFALIHLLTALALAYLMQWRVITTSATVFPNATADKPT
jgi:hypothetical protein